jgi:hypothetical protein
MNVLGALLIVLNVATILGPIAGVAVIYQSNLDEMVIPPQIQTIINGGSGGNGNTADQISIFTDKPLELPQFVSASADTMARSASIVLNFTNPFNFDLNLNSIGANIFCAEHNFALGHASLEQPVVLSADKTSDITIVCDWTVEAENHFLTDHPEASSIDVNVKELTINVNGITIQSTEPYLIPNLPISNQIAPPQFVNSQPDLAARTVDITFSYVNLFPYDLQLDSVSADITCTNHNFLVGHAVLANPSNIPASETSNFIIICSWTQEAENHFAVEHSGASSIDVEVNSLTINVNGISIRAPGSYHIPNVPIS